MNDYLTPAEQRDLLAAMRRGWAIWSNGGEWYAVHSLDIIMGTADTVSTGDMSPSHGGAPTLAELLEQLPEVERALVHEDAAQWAAAFELDGI